MNLSEARKTIDDIDNRILQLLCEGKPEDDATIAQLLDERDRVSITLTRFKLRRLIPIVDLEREQDVITRRMSTAERLGLDPERVGRLFRSAITRSTELQREVWRMSPQQRILTGMRPTGRLHLGHYVGALEKWLELQNSYECYFLIADYQALGDHFGQMALIKDSVFQVTLDWLAVGLDPEQSSFLIQSQIPEHAELTLLLSMVTPLNWLVHNPTLREEMGIKQKDYTFADIPDHVSVGFFTYPMSQVADILLPKAHLVPVGEDQVAHIEFTRDVARRFNNLFGKTVFPIPDVLVGRVPRLVGLDGQQKMSKSLGNTIELSDDSQTVNGKVMSMFTDPTRARATDPGHVQGNPVFMYHDAFNANKEEVEELKRRYEVGRVGDVEVKRRLAEVLNQFLDPIRERRMGFERRPQLVKEALARGTERAREVAQATMSEVRDVMEINEYLV